MAILLVAGLSVPGAAHGTMSRKAGWAVRKYASNGTGKSRGIAVPLQEVRNDSKAGARNTFSAGAPPRESESRGYRATLTGMANRNSCSSLLLDSSRALYRLRSPSSRTQSFNSRLSLHLSFRRVS